MTTSPHADRKLNIFETEVRALVNRESIESLCDIPDYAIARYLRKALENLCEASELKAYWAQGKPAETPRAAKHLLEGEASSETESRC